MKKDNMSWFPGVLLGSLVVIVVLALYVPAAWAQTSPIPFKIGIVTAVSGGGHAYGKRATIGIRYRVEEEINKSGGINGHPVKLLIYDTQTRPDQAAMLVERADKVGKVQVVLG